MDAKQLYEAGIEAFKANDLLGAQRLMKDALKLEPRNVNAWLWLARTLADPAQQMRCIEQALKINATHAQALRMKAALTKPPEDPFPDIPIPPVRNEVRLQERLATGEFPAQKPATLKKLARKTAEVQVTLVEKTQIQDLIRQGDAVLRTGNLDEAVSKWIAALAIQVDHPDALEKAVRNLWKHNYHDDAWTLINRALQAGTTLVAVYLLAIELADEQKQTEKATQLRLKMASLPGTSEGQIGRIVRYLLDENQPDLAVQAIDSALVYHPKSQLLLIQAGDIKTQRRKVVQSLPYYDRAARLDPFSEYGKYAENILRSHQPVLADWEKSSLWLAVREACGVAIVYLLLAFQDAGLSIRRFESLHWLGILLAFPAAYLLVTATSSPQQAPLAGWLRPASAENGELPILSQPVRLVFGVVGAVILLIAFFLVFHQALDLLMNPVEPSNMPDLEELFGGA